MHKRRKLFILASWILIMHLVGFYGALAFKNLHD